MSEFVTTAFGRKIRQVRQSRALSIRDLAKKLGKTPGYISRIECRGEIPSSTLICRLAQALAVRPEILLHLAKSDRIERQVASIKADQEQALLMYRKTNERASATSPRNSKDEES